MREQIETLQQKLSDLLGGGGSASAAVPKTGKTRGRRGGKRVMSPEARARIAAAQTARWAKVRGKAAPAKAAAKAPAKATAKAASKKKGGLTPEGRAKLAAAMKARWAARRKGGSAPNASA